MPGLPEVGRRTLQATAMSLLVRLATQRDRAWAEAPLMKLPQALEANALAETLALGKWGSCDARFLAFSPPEFGPQNEIWSHDQELAWYLILLVDANPRAKWAHIRDDALAEDFLGSQHPSRVVAPSPWQSTPFESGLRKPPGYFQRYGVSLGHGFHPWEPGYYQQTFEEVLTSTWTWYARHAREPRAEQCH